MPLAWRLSAAQWDVLTEVLGLERYPSPIQVHSHGRTRVERARVRADVCVELAELGLLRAGRVDADLETALRLLHWPATWVDSVWLADAVADQPVRVVAARGGSAGVCALQRPDQPGATLLTVIPATGLAAAVTSRLPSHPPGRSTAVTVTPQPGAGQPGARQPGVRQFGARQDGVRQDGVRQPGARQFGAPQPATAQPGGGLLVSASPVRSSAERDNTAAAAILDKPHARAGQIAANTRDPSGQVRRSDILRWCDNVDGRYQVTVNRRSGEPMSLTVGPSDPQRLGEGVQRLLAALQP
ncbi:MAG: ESX secretion-associated protein EspG [Pseudonocardiaceae bacterium]